MKANRIIVERRYFFGSIPPTWLIVLCSPDGEWLYPGIGEDPSILIFASLRRCDPAKRFEGRRNYRR
jgi:hypothetical protein